ncbi:MAG TPA: AAA family ATPase, partial [Mycobacteriales bacterium]|nr:AAA family ATPase [Mycobacteriales bacterium]
AHPWPAHARVSARMGLHAGAAEVGDDRGYVSLALHQAARVGAAPHGGQIVATAEVANALADDPDVLVEVLGSFWLKDFPEPVQLHALGGADGRADLRAPRVPRADLSNLPSLRTGLVGREHELDTCLTALDRPGLLTITGPGGVGKTRLALEAAARHAASGRASWLAELAGVHPTGTTNVEQPTLVASVVTAVARAIGSDAAETTALVRQLMTSSMLIVIDNAEHLAEAVAEVVESLARECPRLRIVVTSREPLAVPDEAILRLQPLPAPDLGAPPAAVDTSPAVQLFVERSRAVQPAFRIDDRNRDDVADLCRALDGLPLALELAAARVSTLGTSALLERVRAVGDVPGTLGRGRAARHATLTAVLEWSLDLCSPAEIAVLRRLAVFGGPVDLDAVVEVTGGEGLRRDEVVDAIVSLAHKSLVGLRESGLSPTYDLLTTVRQAALTRLLAEGERDEACARHAQWVLTRVRAASANDVEHDPAVVAALATEIELALERGSSGAVAPARYLELVLALRDHFTTRAPELGLRHATALAAQPLSVGSRARVTSIVAKCMVEVMHPGCAAAIQTAIAAARDAADPELLGRALMGPAELDLSLHSPVSGPADLRDSALTPGARANLDEAEELLERVAETSVRAAIYLATTRAWIAADAKDLEQARAMHLDVLAIATRVGFTFHEGVSHFNLGEVAELAGDTGSAVAHYRRSADILLDVGALTAGAYSLIQMALVQVARAEPAALETAAEAVLTARRARSITLLRSALLAQASAAELAGEPALAARARSEASTLDADGVAA